MKTKNIIVAAALMSCALVAHAQPLDQRQAAVSETEVRGRACFHTAAVDTLRTIADEHQRNEDLVFAAGAGSGPGTNAGGAMLRGFGAELEQGNRQQAYRQQEEYQVKNFMVDSCAGGVMHHADIPANGHVAVRHCFQGEANVERGICTCCPVESAMNAGFGCVLRSWLDRLIARGCW